MKKLITILFCMVFLINFVSAEEIWSETYGGGFNEESYSIALADDGGFVLAGGTESFGEGDWDVYLVKVDDEGDEEWSQTYGSTGTDYSTSLVKTNDGGYAVCGTSRIFGNGIFDFYLIKTDSEGNEEWSNFGYGGGGYDHCNSVLETDEGYSMAGKFDGSHYDFYLVQTDEDGDEVWSQSYNNEWSESATSHIMLEDDGFIMVGNANTNNDNSWNIYIVRTDDIGNEIWSQTFGESNLQDGAGKIIETSDGNFVLVGYTESFGEGNSDFYLIKIDVNGSEIWSQTYGGLGDDRAYSVIQTEDNGLLIVGYTESFGNGLSDCYVVKTDSEGNEEWSQTYGGFENDVCNSVVESPDGNYVLGGSTESFGHGEYDLWVFKIESGFGEPTLEQRVDALEQRVEILNQRLNLLQILTEQINNNVLKIFTYLRFTPEDIREDMICGYMEENDLEHYNSLGLHCERDGRRCACEAIEPIDGEPTGSQGESNLDSEDDFYNNDSSFN